MGNIKSNNSRIYANPYVKKEIDNIEIDKALQKKITDLIYSSCNNVRIPLEKFSSIINLNPKSTFTKKLLPIFTNSQNEFSTQTLYIMYQIFKNKDPNNIFIKSLLTEFLFDTNDKLSLNQILSNYKIYFSHLPDFKSTFPSDPNQILTKQSFLETILPNSNLFCKNNSKFHLYKPLSITFEPSFNLKKFTPFSYCNCFIQNIQELNENELLTLYGQTRNYFDKVIKGSKDFLSIDDFCKFFRGKIHRVVLHYAVKYFREFSGKNYLSFEMFVRFFMGFHITKSYGEKVKYFFNMMIYPKESITVRELENKCNFQEGKLSKLEGMNEVNTINDEKFKEISPFVFELIKMKFQDITDQIGMLPFIEFNVVPSEVKIKQKMIQIFMKNKTIDCYLEECFPNENKFYVISSSFWNTFDSNYTGPIPNEIDISYLLLDPSIYKESLKEGLKYKKDFYIIPQSLYNVITKYFPIKSIIINKCEPLGRPLLYYNKRTIKTKQLNIGEFNYDLNNNIITYQKDENILEEVDMFPVFTVVLKLDQYITNVRKDTHYQYVLQSDVVNSIKKSLRVETDTVYILRKKVGLNGDHINRSVLLDDYLKHKYNNKIYTTMKIFTFDNKYTCINYIKEYNNITIGNLTSNKVLILFGCLPNEQKRYLSDFICMKGNKDEIKQLEKQYMESITKEENKSQEKEVSVKLKNVNNNTNVKRNIKEKKDIKDEKQIKIKEEEKKKEIEIDETILVTPFGLNNLGNTCYFNSIIQIFLNMPQMQRLFKDPKLKYFINKNSKFGQKGKFISLFLTLFKQSKKTLRPTLQELHKFIGKINSNFNNFNQQDAHEFLTTLLDVFHEELNLKNDRPYIINNNKLMLSQEQSSNIYWANSLRRSVSFINALFMFQIKSNLTCNICGSSKTSYETNYTLDLPISEAPIVTINVDLYRLPLCYKIYLDKINNQFRKYNNEHKATSIVHNLKSFAFSLDSSSQAVNSYKNYFTLTVPVSLFFEMERNKPLKYIISKIRDVKDLELEPEDDDSINDIYSLYKEIKVNTYTSFVITSTSGDVLDVESEITTYVSNQNSVNFCIYEVLNSNGMYRLIDCFLNKKIKGEIKDDDFNFEQSFNEKYRNNKQDNNDLLLRGSLIHALNYSDYTSRNVNKNNNNTNKRTYNTTSSSKTDEQSFIQHEETIPLQTSNSFPFDILFFSKNHQKSYNHFSSKKTSLFSTSTLTSDIATCKNKSDINTSSNKEIVISFNNLISKEQKLNIKPEIEEQKLKNFKNEMIIPIVNCFDIQEFRFFQNFYLNEIDNYPKQCIIVNNSEHFLTIQQLYEFIWEMNSIYLINRDTSRKVWFRYKEQKGGCACSPFVLRLITKHKDEDNQNINLKSNNLLHTKCAICPWYTFCPGCILNPFLDNKRITFEPSYILIVDWCNKVKQNEISADMFYKKFKNNTNLNELEDNNVLIHRDFNINNNVQYKTYKDKTIYDCMELFLEKEDLDDQLYCGNCQCVQNFTKNYEFDKMPHILIILFKRFKYNVFTRNKLSQFIVFPLDNFTLNNSSYDLYGVVNHYGSFSSGHYTSIIKIRDQWYKLDDNTVTLTNKNNIINSHAYMLFYIKKNYTEKDNDYYRMLNSIKDRIIEREGKKTEYNADINLFKGEPVLTPYGRGYVIEDWKYSLTEKVKVQFSYGEGCLHRSRVTKEIEYLFSNYS